MKTLALLSLLGCAYCSQGRAQPSALKRVNASVDCGSFQLNSVTDEIMVPHEFTRATFQAIQLVNRSRRIDTHLDLKQHLSQDSKLGRILDIDGVATEWWCIRAPSGSDFVFIDFVCAEENAKSCSTAMGEPSADWRQVYDSKGQALFRKPPESSSAEDDLMKKLGIASAFYAPIVSDPAKQIYDAY